MKAHVLGKYPATLTIKTDPCEIAAISCGHEATLLISKSGYVMATSHHHKLSGQQPEETRASAEGSERADLYAPFKTFFSSFPVAAVACGWNHVGELDVSLS
jgi:hypothetical protein